MSFTHSLPKSLPKPTEINAFTLTLRKNLLGKKMYFFTALTGPRHSTHSSWQTLVGRPLQGVLCVVLCAPTLGTFLLLLLGLALLEVPSPWEHHPNPVPRCTAGKLWALTFGVLCCLGTGACACSALKVWAWVRNPKRLRSVEGSGGKRGVQRNQNMPHTHQRWRNSWILTELGRSRAVLGQDRNWCSNHSVSLFCLIILN